VLRALDRTGGSQAWKTELPQRPTDGPFLSAKLLLVPGMSADVHAFQIVDGSPAGSAKLAADPIAPPLFLPAAGDKLGRLVVVTGEGQAQLLVPGLPVLKSRQVPGVPLFTLPPAIEGTPPAPES
jgi:hypothetical protein